MRLESSLRGCFLERMTPSVHAHPVLPAQGLRLANSQFSLEVVCFVYKTRKGIQTRMGG